MRFAARAARRQAGRDRRALDARRRHGAQGDRPDARRRRPAGAGLTLEGGRIVADADGRTGARRCLGRRRLSRRRPRPDGRGGRARQARRASSTPHSHRCAPRLTPPEGATMADLSNTFVGIRSPNPFWLASAPPTDKEYNVAARLRGRLGRRGLEDARRGRAADRQRQRPALRRAARARPARDRLQQHRAHHRPAAADQPRRDPPGQARLARPRAGRLADGAVRRRARGRRSWRGSRTPAPTASSSTSAARTA